eukprot:75568_1
MEPEALPELSEYESDHPRNELIIKLMNSISRTQSSQWRYKRKCFIFVVFVLLSIIPICASILLMILIEQHQCTTSDSIESITLLSATLILFISFLFATYKNNKHIKKWIRVICYSLFLILYLIQWCIIIDILQFHPIACVAGSWRSDLLHYLLLSWIVLYGAVLFTMLIAICCKINAASTTNGFGSFILICAVFCQLGVVLIPSSIQFVLVEVVECTGPYVITMLETVLLPILTFIGSVVALAMMATRDNVLFTLLCLFVVIADGCIMHSCVTWSASSMDCGEYTSMKIAACIFFGIIAVEFSIFNIALVCFGYVYRLKPCGSD